LKERIIFVSKEIPKQYVHRVDLALLKENNIGLISVDENDLDFIFIPKTEEPQDVISYYFLSELFAKEFKAKVLTLTL
jgi:hypothetical protein